MTDSFTKHASVYDVHPEIHEEDFLFRYLIDVLPDTEAAIENYFSDGKLSAEKLSDLLRNKLNISEGPRSILDFASGFGMVARHFKNTLPTGLKLTTSDIHPEANSFNALHLGCDTIQSAYYPEQLEIDRKFDVVFCLSFFSHIGHEYFQRWLAKLYSLVEDGGFLVFTTHGRFTPNGACRDLSPGELQFIATSEQKDLDPNLYGVSFATPEYVLGALRQVDARGPDKYRVSFFAEAFWWGHQDIYAIAKL